MPEEQTRTSAGPSRALGARVPPQWAGALPRAEVPSRAEVPPRAAAPTANPTPWAWGVVFAPMVLLIAAVLAAVLWGTTGSTAACLWAGIFACWIPMTICAVKDAGVLRSAGELTSTELEWPCLLGGWVYLLIRAVKRANRSTTDWVILGVSAAIWLVVIVMAVPIVNSVITSSSTFERAKVQREIAQGITALTGVIVTVNCPQEPPMSPGSRFECVAAEFDGVTAKVTVRVQDRSGDFTWQIAG
jgi:hypothetical protein